MVQKRSSIVLDETQPDQNRLVPLTMTPGQLTTLIEQNLGGETITPGDLERAINPSGKGTKWSFIGLDGEEELVNEIVGVIVHSKTKRAYFSKKFSGGGERPECFSDDGFVGRGTIASQHGGDCIACPMAQFGSGENGSQACSSVKRLFVLRAGDMLPTIVNATPINNRAPKKYGIRLMNKRSKALDQVITRLTLSTAKSTSGFDYAKLDLALVSELDPDSLEKMRAYTAMIRPLLDSITIEHETREQAIGEFAEPQDVLEVVRPLTHDPAGERESPDFDTEF
jgi:hypothetical protein